MAEELLIFHGGLCVKESVSPQGCHVTSLRTCRILRCSDSHRTESGQLYSQSTTKKMRRFSIYFFLQDALHVSDGFSVHHQELKTAHTASGICQTITAWSG